MQLFEEVAAAAPVAGAINVYPRPIEGARITVRTERVNDLLGTLLTTGEIAAYLEPLGIATRDGIAVAPTFRPDLEREIDLVEEVARRFGLDRIARTVPSNPETIGGLSPAQGARRALVDVLVGAGYDEIYTLPLLAPADLGAAGTEPAGVIEVENPLRAEESILRPALLPGVLRSVAFNAAHGEPDVALFEAGTVFALPLDGERLPHERVHIAFARSHAVRRVPHEPDRAVDVYDATAIVGALTGELRLAGVTLEAASIEGMHPGRAAHVLVDGRPAGRIGEVAAAVVDALGLVAPVVVGELDVDALLAGERVERRARTVSRFPASTIDLAFVVDDNVPAARMQATLTTAAGELLEHVALFDVFRSDALGSANVSLAFSLRFRAPDRTLTDDEVGALRQACIDAVVGECGAQLRA